MIGSESKTVKVVIPCLPEYVNVVRLAVLGISNRMPFSYDEVEDLRLAVAEACTRAVERAGEAEATLTVTSTVTKSALTIAVADDVPEDKRAKPSAADLPESPGEFDPIALGAILMELLVDDVQIQTTPAGTTVILTKSAPD